MGFINVAERTINAKLVYYGVGVGGKTTSLQQVHGIFCPRNEVQLVSINTEEDSTLLFDFLPINLGSVGGFKVRIQGFTVPGQPKYKQMRKYVLQGADAVVLVVDSQRSRLQENIDSMHGMLEHLREQVGTSEDIPIIVQYNKRDLDDVLSEDELDKHFKFRDDVVSFPSIATEGHGVFEAFVEATGKLIERKVDVYGLKSRSTGSASQNVAEEVRSKLWGICDEVRRGRETVSIEDLPFTRVALPDDVSQPVSSDDASHSDRIDLGSVAPIRSNQPTSGKEQPDKEEEIGFGYELREESGPSYNSGSAVGGNEVLVGNVLTDEELNLDLAPDLAVRQDQPDEGAESALLGKTVRSNLELVARFGELDEKRLLLERKVDELVDIAQCTVHDLNRPITSVRLMLSTLSKGYLGKMADKQSEAVENGLMAIKQMERLVGDLLDSSRLDHDGVRLNLEECDLTVVVADVLRTLHHELDDGNLMVRVEPLPVVLADSWSLTKALMNLLGNAISYRDTKRTPLVRIFCEDRGDIWALAVSDNGIGIPESDRERLFGRFERGSNTGSISGSGLGLHIVKEIVQGHGGTVVCESDLNTGTTFWLNLPKKPILAEHSPLSDVAAGADL